MGGDVAERGVVLGPLLGPVSSLTFSTDERLLFASSGSFLHVYDVECGDLLLSSKIFDGVAVDGLDIADKGVGAIFGHRYLRIVSNVPDGGSIQLHEDAPRPSPFENSSWFAALATLPELEHRVWDARIIYDVHRVHLPSCEANVQLKYSVRSRRSQARAEFEDQAKAGCGSKQMVAVALAHHSVELWEWCRGRVGAERMLRACSTEPCFLYHARLFGRTCEDLRVAAGTVYNQPLSSLSSPEIIVELHCSPRSWFGGPLLNMHRP
ncbi:unnamed protein product, partial [Discosporangium mesarthrocarpum]